MSNQEQLNFLLTNRIPRRWATLFMGWFSRLESRLLARLSIGVWQRFADDLRLDEAEHTDFVSLHDCFTRRLKAGARPVHPDGRIVASPCDAVVGEHGRIDGNELIQAKGFPYTLDDLVCDPALAERYNNGMFVTLRIKSSMYHRFHAPCDCRITGLSYISGDTWNVNPVALKRVERLFCKNERAVIELQLADERLGLALVPVAAILVASMQFSFLDEPLDLRYRGPNRISANGAFTKGDEMGFFQHGSTIIVLATPEFQLAGSLSQGEVIRAGQPLLRAPATLSGNHSETEPTPARKEA